MSKFALLTIMLVFLQSLAAYDINVGRQTGLGEGILLSSPSASDMLTCPTGIMTRNRLIFETGFQRKFELSDLDRVFICTGYRHRNFSGVVGFSQFGRQDYYVDQLLKTAVSYSLDSFMVSVTLAGRRVEIGSKGRKSSLRVMSVGLAGGVNYDKYHLAFVIDNINQPRFEPHTERDNAVYNIYAEIEGPSQFSVTGHVAFEKDKKAMLSVGQYIKLIDCHAVFWGLSNNPLTFGGGVEIRHSRIELTYAVSNHPVLGLSHNISLGFLWDRREG